MASRRDPADPCRDALRELCEPPPKVFDAVLRWVGAEVRALVIRRQLGFVVADCGPADAEHPDHQGWDIPEPVRKLHEDNFNMAVNIAQFLNTEHATANPLTALVEQLETFRERLTDGRRGLTPDMAAEWVDEIDATLREVRKVIDG